MTPFEFLQSRGNGFYALHEIAQACSLSLNAAREQLDLATEAGRLEQRVYRARRLRIGTRGAGKGAVQEAGEWETLEQWRVVT